MYEMHPSFSNTVPWIRVGEFCAPLLVEGGGDTQIKLTGMIVGNFERSALKGTRNSFCGRVRYQFLLKSYTNNSDSGHSRFKHT